MPDTLIVTLASAFFMGLIGSTHCIGMCGGIVSTLNAGLATSRKHRPLTISLAYNIGRITSYSIIGLLIGLFSSQLMNSLPDPHAVSMKIGGVFFVLLGLYITQWLNGFKYFELAGGKLFRYIEPLGRKYLPPQKISDALLLGLVWGWLPCGLVYSALALAITQTDASFSMLTMAVFGLGTLPTLLLIGHFASQVRFWLQQPLLRQILGVLMIVYGLSLLLGTNTFMSHAH